MQSTPASLKKSGGSSLTILFRSVGFGALMLAVSACGQDNAADCERGQKPLPCIARSAEDDARQALDARDYDRAIELYALLVADAPDEYERYPLLAAAMAARGGVSVFGAFASEVGSGGSGQGLQGALRGIVPDRTALGDEAYDRALTDVQGAIDVLLSIPLEVRATDAPHAVGARVLLTLTQAAYSIMYLNKFVAPSQTGDLDPSRLEEMTPADAAVILQSLAAAAAAQSGEEGEALRQKVAEALAAIDDQPGATQLDKLKEYARQQQGGAAP